ncbi:MAG: oligoendopeptidase F [Bacillota bacterium]
MAEGKQLPRRDEIAAESKWRLEDIYARVEDWEKELRDVKQAIPEISALAGHLGEGADKLCQVLELDTNLGRKISSLFVYAKMRFDEDTSNAVSRGLVDRAENLSTEVASATAFMVPEILAIPEATLQQYIRDYQPLQLYRHFLEDLTRLREHFLSASEEQILAQAGELAAGPGTIFDMFNHADLKFPVVHDEDGDEIRLTHGRYIQLMESPKREVRQEAFTALYETYRKYKNTMSAIFASNIKRDIFFSRARRYSSSLEASLAANKIPTAVYDNLIAAVRSNLPALHRYVALRRRALGLEQLHMYDLYTPIVKDYKVTIPYGQAAETVVKGLAVLGDQYQQALKKGLEDHWVDVHETEGKQSGAYSWGTYDTHPYVLLNYQDNLDNMFTLAHEMGHSLHTYFSQKNQPYIYAGYSTFVAEVASTANEALLMDYLLKNTSDQKMQGYLINHYLEQFRGTVYRQTMFAEFEQKVHAMAEAGEALTVDRLCEIYHQLNRDYYGPEMVVDDLIALEWMRIPHFYNNFYVFQYATGYSAAIALSQAILSEGQGAVERYLGFLRAGGSDYPIEVLSRAGVNMATPEPVNAALQVFADLIGRMEELV